MEKNDKELRRSRRFAVLINLLIIVAVALIGIAIAYFSIALFTKHGEQSSVPGVENMSYTDAVKVLHGKGFNVEIRDSLFRDDVKPGYVIEQFPRANSVVKPGRKVFLYINAVHPKEVIMDDGADKLALALKDWSQRQARARLTELGFKNIRVVTVLGADDRVVKIMANGKPVFQMQKVPVNAQIIVEVSDGRLGALRDSLYEAERIREYHSMDFGDYPGNASYGGSSGDGGSVYEEPDYFEDPDYFDEPEFLPVNE